MVGNPMACRGGRMVGSSSLLRMPAQACFRPVPLPFQRARVMCSDAAAGSMAFPEQPGSEQNSETQPPAEKNYTPFPRMKEGDPYKLLGLTGGDAAFDEVVEARNFLIEEYRWHAPSREAIELAYENIIQNKLKHRKQTGFQSGLPGRPQFEKTETPSLLRRIEDLFDPTVTMATLINEGLVYVGLALWALNSTDQSFPLAGAFAYSVYKFQTKRTKTNPDGPHFGGNPIVGALIATLFSLGVGCGLMALATPVLKTMIEGTIRNVGGFVVITIIGLFGVYLK